MESAKTMCVVDDNNMIHLYMSNLIKSNSLIKKFVFFNSAVKALDFLNEMSDCEGNLPDIILLDLDMPEMSGWEFLNHFESIKDGLSKQIDIYIHSYSASTAQAVEAKNLNCVKQVICKPIDQFSLDSILAA